MGARVTIRQATPTDADAIGALTREAYTKWIPIAGREPKPMAVDYAEALRSHRFDLLFAGGELAALIETLPQGDELLIENVAVRPALQKRGYGRALLKLAEELAAAADLKGTRLYTNKLFDENIRLYAALGYEIEREEVLGDRTAVHMVKPLTHLSHRERAGSGAERTGG